MVLFVRIKIHGCSHLRTEVQINNSMLNLDNDQLDAQILIHLLQSATCTCFKQYLAHPREIKLY
jgi:hypothetical protein